MSDLDIQAWDAQAERVTFRAGRVLQAWAAGREVQLPGLPRLRLAMTEQGQIGLATVLTKIEPLSGRPEEIWVMYELTVSQFFAVVALLTEEQWAALGASVVLSGGRDATAA